MDSQQVIDLFREEAWTKKLHKQLVIPSQTYILQTKDIQFLIDDETNPKLQNFRLREQIQKGIKQLKGAVFMKCAGRSPKDIVTIDRKIKSVIDIVMAIKMSQYLTEGLSQQIQGCQLILRQFSQQLNNQSNQFRAYVLNEQLVGICQKNPSFVAEQLTVNQIKKIQQITNIIAEQITQSIKNQQKSHRNKKFVFDVYCQQTGKKALIISIEPFHIHALSLFSEQQLKNHYRSGNKNPLIRTVKKQNQLKQINLSQYKAGNQLKNYQNMKEWIEFVQKQQQGSQQ